MAFEKLVEFSSNFCMLNDRIPDTNGQKKYIDSWKNRYTAHFSNSQPIECFLWNIRVHKSLKEMFCSSLMYLEALVAKKARSWSSFYFLSYYSLFHAFLSCVYMLPDQSFNQLTEITHSKLQNIFKSSFCAQKQPIVNLEMCEAFSVLKYMREYYSYHMPPNHFLYKHPDNVKPDLILPDYLKACFQLSNLQSQLVYWAFNKHQKSAPDPYELYEAVHKYYPMVNSRKHPLTDNYLLDYVDEVRMEESYKFPAPVPHVNELEHFSDEFGMYLGSEFPYNCDGIEISPSRFVYGAIMLNTVGVPRGQSPL